jgi:hypothetical protein
LRDPYDAALVPTGVECLATYSTQASSMEALAMALYGEIGCPGRSPVNLSRS